VPPIAGAEAAPQDEMVLPDEENGECTTVAVDMSLIKIRTTYTIDQLGNVGNCPWDAPVSARVH